MPVKGCFRATDNLKYLEKTLFSSFFLTLACCHHNSKKTYFCYIIKLSFFLLNYRKYFGDTITDAYSDLALNKTFKALADSINKIVILYEYRARLFEEEAKNRT